MRKDWVGVLRHYHVTLDGAGILDLTVKDPRSMPT